MEEGWGRVPMWQHQSGVNQQEDTAGGEGWLRLGWGIMVMGGAGGSIPSTRQILGNTTQHKRLRFTLLGRGQANMVHTKRPVSLVWTLAQDVHPALTTRKHWTSQTQGLLQDN
jgi:hypothetical protein